MLFYTEKKQQINNPVNHKINTITLITTIQDSLPGILSKNCDDFPPMFHHTSTGKRAAFRIFKRASFTIESALVLPLFLLSSLALFSLLDFYRIYLDETISLCEKAKKTAACAYDPSNSSPLQKLYPDGYLTLSKVVTYRILYAPFPLPAIRVSCYSRVHLWCGYQGTEWDSDSISSYDDMVYVTDYESVYHTSSSCSHLSFQIDQKTLAAAQNSKNQNGAHYDPCEKCIGSGLPRHQVYLTQYGTAYHNSPNCSGLKRSIRLIPQSEVPNLHICSRCEKNS